MFNLNRQARLWVNRVSKLVIGRPIAFPPIPKNSTIRFYKRYRPDFGFLSNLYSAPIEIEGRTWPHNEASYQSQKSRNPVYHARKLEPEKPSWSKHVGDPCIGDPKLAEQSWFRTHPEELQDAWEQIKMAVMQIAFHTKFTQHFKLRWLLISTGNAFIKEDSTSDYFWGCGFD